MKSPQVLWPGGFSASRSCCSAIPQEQWPRCRIDAVIAARRSRCGEVVPRGIQCGYHGLVFDSSGKCVLVPGDHKVPPGAQVRAYPAVERDALVWVWMGDPEKADRAQIIRYPYHNDSRNWPHQHTMMHLRSDYLLVLDNLMDLSHLGYVHKGNVGGDANTHVEAKMRTVRTPNGVRFERWMLDSTPPPTYVKTVGFKGKVDRWQEVEFVAPNAVLQWNGAIDAGTGALRDWQYSSPRENCFSFRLFHGITPETETPVTTSGLRRMATTRMILARRRSSSMRSRGPSSRIKRSSKRRRSDWRKFRTARWWRFMATRPASTRAAQSIGCWPTNRDQWCSCT